MVMAKGARSWIMPIRMMASNAYVVTNGKQSILIDAGMKKKEEKIVAAIERMQLSPADIKLIILTHTHYDHCGSLKALQEITKAKVLVHKAEAACLKKGYTELPKGTMWFSKIMSVVGRTMARKMGEYAPVTADITISKKFDLKKYGIDGYVLPTPGHSAGSLSVIIEKKHAVVGDTLFDIFTNSVLPAYADDQEELFKSWKKLLDIGCEYFYPGHGKPFTRERLEKTYVEKKR
jgi:hydroxyacylglutathione hydrolase